MNEMRKLLLLVIIALMGLNCSHAQETPSDSEVGQLLDLMSRVYSMGCPSKDLQKQAAQAAARLKLLGERLLPYLLARLRNGSSRDAAAFCIILPCGIPEVIEMSRDKNDDVRSRTVGLMGQFIPEGGFKMVDPRLISRLQQVAVADSNPSIRESALCSLDNLRTVIDETTASKVLADPSEKVRYMAVCILAYWPDIPRKEERLTGMAADTSAVVRYAVGITSNNKKMAIPLLKEAVTNDSLAPWQRERAEWKLKNHTAWMKE